MRVTSEFWVSAVTRRVFNAGGYAAVVRRGATEAGAIFVMVRSRDGTCNLFGPASQTSYDEAGPQERRFHGRWRKAMTRRSRHGLEKGKPLRSRSVAAGNRSGRQARRRDRTAHDILEKRVRRCPFVVLIGRPAGISASSQSPSTR